MKKERTDPLGMVMGNLRPIRSDDSFCSDFREGLKAEVAKKAAETFTDRMGRITGMVWEFEVMPRMHLAVIAIVSVALVAGGLYVYQASPARMMVVSREGIAVVKNPGALSSTSGLVKAERSDIIRAVEDTTKKLREDKEIPAKIRAEIEQTSRSLVDMAASSRTEAYYYKGTHTTSAEFLREAAEKTFPSVMERVSPVISAVPMTIVHSGTPGVAGETQVAAIRHADDIGSPATKSYDHLHIRELRGADELYPDIVATILREKIRDEALTVNVIEVKEDGSLRKRQLVHDKNTGTFALEGLGPIAESAVREAAIKDENIMISAFSELDDSEAASITRLDAGQDQLVANIKKMIEMTSKDGK